MVSPQCETLTFGTASWHNRSLHGLLRCLTHTTKRSRLHTSSSPERLACGKTDHDPYLDLQCCATAAYCRSDLLAILLEQVISREREESGTSSLHFKPRCAQYPRQIRSHFETSTDLTESERRGPGSSRSLRVALRMPPPAPKISKFRREKDAA